MVYAPVNDSTVYGSGHVDWGAFRRITIPAINDWLNFVDRVDVWVAVACLATRTSKTVKK